MRGEVAVQRVGVVKESMMLLGRALQAVGTDTVCRTARRPNMAARASTGHYQPATVTVKLPLGGRTTKVTCAQVTQRARLRGVRVGGSRRIDHTI